MLQRLTSTLQWSYERAQVFLAQMRACLQDCGTHAYLLLLLLLLPYLPTCSVGEKAAPGAARRISEFISQNLHIPFPVSSPYIHNFHD